MFRISRSSSRVGIADINLKHEAIELRLGKLIGSLVFDRVLRGQDQKRIRKRVGRVADGHLTLLHRFEKRALDFGRGAVDLVRENEVGKNRPKFSGELAVPGIVDQSANKVGGEKIGGELNPLKTRPDAGGHGADGKRFRQPGNAFKQHMAVAEEAGEKPVDELFLTDHHFADFRNQWLNPLARLQNLTVCLLCKNTHKEIPKRKD